MLSAIIITFNEEDVIRDCIESLKDFADEIIVLDSHSEDKTREIARQLGADVYEHKLVDFASQRNAALEYAKGDFVYYIDSDERATPEFKNEVNLAMKLYSPELNVGGWYIKRKTFYLGKDWGLTDKVQRLFYKKKLLKWVGEVHETPVIDGSYANIPAPILHFTHRNLSQMVEKTNKWSDFEAELRMRTHHPKMSALRFLRVILTGFSRSYISEGGWRNGTRGMIESMYQGYSMFVTYAKLWEMQNKKH